MVQPAVKGDGRAFRFVQVLVQNLALDRSMTGEYTVCAVVQVTVPKGPFR